MSYLRYAARMYNVPLLITSDKARILEQVVRAHEEGRASLLSPAVDATPRRELTAPGMVRTESGYVRTAEGIAIIQTVGTFVQRGGDEQLDALSGLVAYSSLGSQMQAAEYDPRTDAVLWEVDTNGGEVPGLVDAVSRIKSVASKKPVWAIANEKAFSAGMWAATAANKLFVPQTGMVGSIGVRMLHVDQSQRDAKQGIVYTEIVAGERKADFSTHAPLSDAARATAQEEVDRIYEMFVTAIADHRGIDSQIVRDTQAGLLAPRVALALGLIDGIQSFDETLAQLAAEAQHVRINGMRTSARASAPALPAHLSQGENEMDQKELDAKLAAAKAEGEAKGKADAEAAATKALADADAATKTTARAAADTERKRVHAIQTCEAAKGKPALAAHLALETEMSVEDAQKLLAKAAVETPSEPGNLLAAHMAVVPNPKVGAEEGGDGEETEAAVVTRIMNAGKPPKLAAVK